MRVWEIAQRSTAFWRSSILSKGLTHFSEACTIRLPINSLEGSHLPAVSASKSETFQSSVPVRIGLCPGRFA